jgi:hydrogenase expression/formation protein HypC
MCLAIPGKVLEIYDRKGIRMARVEFGGVSRESCVEYVPEAEVGDYVLVHVGFALSTIDEEEAKRTYALLEEMGQLSELEELDPGATYPPREARESEAGEA